MRLAVLGLGEAGTLFAADLAAAGESVTAFDPRDVPTPPGVERAVDPVAAVAEAGLVLVVTASADASAVLDTVVTASPAGALVADLSAAGPAAKAERAATAMEAGRPFIDVALMAPVPGQGLRTPSFVSGSGAERYAALMRPLGAPVEIVGERAGDASLRKLLRSVTMKGLAAVVIEAVRAAEQADLAEWLWSDLVAAIEAADGALLERLVRGTGDHASRRVDEMEASAELLESLGVEPLMTRATIASLQRAERDGVPDVPGQPKS
jgi:3-hydroxyisobutyrate dehydrogenase-like beta-hydroxyacid dehydrogenase